MTCICGASRGLASGHDYDCLVHGGSMTEKIDPQTGEIRPRPLPRSSAPATKCECGAEHYENATGFEHQHLGTCPLYRPPSASQGATARPCKLGWDLNGTCWCHTHDKTAVSCLTAERDAARLALTTAQEALKTLYRDVEFLIEDGTLPPSAIEHDAMKAARLALKGGGK